MASITAGLPGNIKVTGTLVEGQGIQYTITLANGTTVGPYTGAQLIDIGSGTQTFPPPATFRLTYKSNTIATSENPDDIEYGGGIVMNMFQIQQYMEKNLAVEPANSDPATPGTVTDPNVENTNPSTITQEPNTGTTTPNVENTSPAQISPDTDPAVLARQQALEAQTGGGQTPTSGDTAPYAEGSAASPRGLQGATDSTQAQATAQDQANFQAFDDWRVRLSLAPQANYLYRAATPGILAPLAATDGVLFPYTPVIAVSYAASYEPTTITHSNYKIFQYNSSSVDNISITCDFTAQDTFEANYLLAVIHFFRSATKMFYGQDENPKPGTPPPLCYLFGLGGFQFEAHPLAITSFAYNLPNDVDYIQAVSTSALAGTQVGNSQTGVTNNGRLGSQATPGGRRPPPNFQNVQAPNSPTYVPTKIQLVINCVPIISRNQISNKFSLTDYATGKLLQGTQRQGGGIW